MQKWKFKRSDPSCGHALQYKFTVSSHYISPVSFGKKAYAVRLLLSSSPSTPLDIHYLTSTKSGSRVEVSMSCYASNKPAQYMWLGLYMFSLQLMCMACQELRCRVALSNLLGLPPLSTLWIGNAQLTCMQTMPVYPQTLFILPCSNPALTSFLFFPPFQFSLACIVSIK